MMDTNINSTRNKIRAIALSVLFMSLGFFLRLVLKIGLDIEISKIAASVLNFALAVFGAFVVFPKLLKQPFGKVQLSEYSRRLGFYWPMNGGRHILLGVILSLCTLGGMLAGSVLTGRYVLNWGTVTLSHTVFSLNPGIWEEFFFRGIIMAVLLKSAKSVKQAALIMILIFGLLHVKGLGLWSWVDVISVMVIAVAFTYAAYKTQSLIAGMVFHFIHDALLFLVQLPEGEYTGFNENMIFYVTLWIGVGLACLLIKLAADRFNVRAGAELYQTGWEKRNI